MILLKQNPDICLFYILRIWRVRDPNPTCYSQQFFADRRNRPLCPLQKRLSCFRGANIEPFKFDKIIF